MSAHRYWVRRRGLFNGSGHGEDRSGAADLRTVWFTGAMRLKIEARTRDGQKYRENKERHIRNNARNHDGVVSSDGRTAGLECRREFPGGPRRIRYDKTRRNVTARVDLYVEYVRVSYYQWTSYY